MLNYLVSAKKNCTGSFSRKILYLTILAKSHPELLHYRDTSQELPEQEKIVLGLGGQEVEVFVWVFLIIE